MTTLKEAGNNLVNTPVTTLVWYAIQVAIIWYIVIPVVVCAILLGGILLVTPSAQQQEAIYQQGQKDNARRQVENGGLVYSQDEYKRQCSQMKMNCDMIRQ